MVRLFFTVKSEISCLFPGTLKPFLFLLGPGVLCFLVLLTNPKLKYKVKVKVDDWVFIKITFSNHPATHPAGKVSKKQDTAIYQVLQILTIYDQFIPVP